MFKNRTLSCLNCEGLSFVYHSCVCTRKAFRSVVLLPYMGKLNSLKYLLRDLKDLTLASFYILFLTSLLLLNTSNFYFKHAYIKRLKRCNGDYNCIQKVFEWCATESEWKSDPTHVYNDICLHYYKKITNKVD